MKPVNFKGVTAVLAKDQPQYRQLPISQHYDQNGTITSCWSLSWRERLLVLFTGRLFFSMTTFWDAPMPILPSTTFDPPKCKNCGKAMYLHDAKRNLKCPSK